MGTDKKNNLILLNVNNKVTDQMRSLISTFVLCYLESIISKLATCKIKVNILASLCSCADLVEPCLVRNIKDRFSSIETHIILNFLFPIRIYHECEDRIG